MIPATYSPGRACCKRIAASWLSAILCILLVNGGRFAVAAETPDLERAAELVIGNLTLMHGNVSVARDGACIVRIEREFSGELATHQRVEVNLGSVTYAESGPTLGPKRNDEAYREIAKHRPHAVFLGNGKGLNVARTETWFDPNPFRLARSFVDEPTFEMFAESVAERDALQQAVLGLADVCRSQKMR